MAARPGPGHPILHVIPLAHIIQTMEGASSPNTKKCKAIYASFISTFGNEIAVLIDTPVAEIRAIQPKVADAIDSPPERDGNPAPGWRWKVRYILARLMSFNNTEISGILS